MAPTAFQRNSTRLAWWPHTEDRRVASYRLRCAQVVDFLATQGLPVTLYRPGSPAPDVLVLSKRYDEASLAHALTLRERHGTRLVLDLCDNHFYAATPNAKWQARADRLRQAAREVDWVVASSEALAQVVKIETGTMANLTVIGDAAEPPYLPAARQRWRHPVNEWRLAAFTWQLRKAHGVRLVWFGHHGSDYAEGGMTDLAKLRGRLEQAHAAQPISLSVVSNNRHKFNAMTRGWSLPVHYLPWRADTVSRALQLHHIALIPATDNPFTRCKTNNRLATALLHGLAVAADAIPSYQAMADCCTLDDWDQGLDRLLSDADWRRAQVARGQDRLLLDGRLQHIAQRWYDTLIQVKSV